MRPAKVPDEPGSVQSDLDANRVRTRLRLARSGGAGSRRIVNQWLRSSSSAAQLQAARSGSCPRRRRRRPSATRPVSPPSLATLTSCSSPSTTSRSLRSMSRSVSRTLQVCSGRDVVVGVVDRAQVRDLEAAAEALDVAGGAPARGRVEERLGDLDAVADGERAGGARGGDRRRRLARDPAVDLRARVGVEVEDAVGGGGCAARRSARRRPGP